MTPSRRILIVGLNYAPEPIGIGPYTAGLAESLVARGHEVRAIVGQPYYPEWKRREGYPQRWIRSQENGVTVDRCPLYVPAEPTGPRRLVHHASFAASAYAAALRHDGAGKPDMVFTIAPSMIAVPAALRIARGAGVPLWLHVQDFEVGAAFATGLLSARGLPARAALGFESRMLRSADMVSTISEPMTELLRSRGLSEDRIFEMRNWANHADLIEAADGTAMRKAWDLDGKFIALYSGNIANKQGLEVVIEAAKLLVHRPDVAFVVSGEGPNRVRLESLASTLPNIRFEDLQPDAKVGELLTMADVHLLPQLEGAADLVLPSKLGNMLSSGRPVIATAAPGTGIARELEGCGVVVPPENPVALAAAIESLCGDPEERAALGKAGRSRAAERWHRKAIVDRFEARMQALLA